jgi:hypothetical protein
MSFFAASDASPWLFAAVIGGFLVIFPLFWSGVLVLLSHCGGWARLAKHYRAMQPPAGGAQQSLIYGRVGWVSYNKVLRISLTAEGFFLETIAIFRPGHPRLFIPWTAVSAHRKARALFGSWVRLDIGVPRTASATLPQRVLEGSPLGGEA